MSVKSALLKSSKLHLFCLNNCGNNISVTIRLSMSSPLNAVNLDIARFLQVSPPASLLPISSIDTSSVLMIVGI